MRTQAAALLAALAFSLPALAQTQGTPAKEEKQTQKKWKIEASGLGGWNAAAQADRVRAILNKDKRLKNLIFDTTGIGYFEAEKNVPELADLNLALKKGHADPVKLSRLTEVEVEKEEVIYQVQISGLGWMGTAIETRDVLSRLEGVIRVHPNGTNGKALVFVREKKAFDVKTIEEALKATKDLRMRKYEIAKL